MDKQFGLPSHGKGDLRKVIFNLSDDPWHGYATEQVWAEAVSENRFRLMNSPFFAKNVSFLDIVFVKPLEAAYEFAGVSIRSGHSTYRIIPSDSLTDHEFALRWLDLALLGCTYESGTKAVMGFRIFSVDVPPSADIFAVYNFLEQGIADRVWDFEEGHCGHLPTKGAD